ncbi:MAG TPA: SPOR domain-containing protein, partial [Terriglobales bacterium]|nr:SPOR domain-containing protein [Terriglobales bacterium]
PPARTVPPAATLPASPPAPSVISPARPVAINPGREIEAERVIATVAAGPSQVPGPNPLLYFDLGRFKSELLADDLSSRVARLGLRTDVIRKSRLWGSSYQVLVGPYDNESEETRIQQQLLSHGYKPRPFERGSRDFLLNSQLSLSGSRLPAGEVTISWESYVADARIKFVQQQYAVATADAKWKKAPGRYSRNEYIYEKNPDGSRTLLEIHFAGMDRSLSFR